MVRRSTLARTEQSILAPWNKFRIALIACARFMLDAARLRIAASAGLVALNLGACIGACDDAPLPEKFLPTDNTRP